METFYCNGKRDFCNLNDTFCSECPNQNNKGGSYITVSGEDDGAIMDRFKIVVHCKDCSCKKAVQIGRVMAWRCPYSTVDVDLNGFCHRGVKMSEDRAN